MHGNPIFCNDFITILKKKCTQIINFFITFCLEYSKIRIQFFSAFRVPPETLQRPLRSQMPAATLCPCHGVLIFISLTFTLRDYGLATDAISFCQTLR